ncbi:DNA repair exonuclease SbcCD ATPase subunit [Geosmithia morbida]|uniref:DNA repair exonuclease SbcCD ATPase subunit n=1 Tax=Geosmithia morbida TaxID=1094350 RepID=A0A9P4YTG5_9HYPO|nr:DNA repair exonuclease SbcCD ATPase subunit [Geosmithia morbida]KAF4122798.1 DNA repair exonuclease SbcCD ATPase subunit [Geosmithia morbida]
MSSTTGPKKPASGGVGRVANSEPGGRSPSPSLSRSSSQRSTSTTTGTAPAGGHARTRSTRTGTPVSARAALQRRDTISMSNAESDARAEAASAVEDLQQRLEKEEKLSEQYRKQNDVLQSKLEEAIKDSGKMEERTHELEELVESLKNEKREATRQIREMETIYEAEKSSILKEKEEMTNREEEMQTVIQRLKDSLSQRNNNNTDDESRTSRQANSSSPSFDGNSFAPPSSLQRSDSRNNSKLILQKDKLIESLRLELAEAQIKLVESENQGGGRLQEVERLLMEARMANARLMEDNESYQLLLQERTLKGDFGQNDFSYMGSNANQDALDALEGKGAGNGGGGGSSLADELDEAADDTIISTATADVAGVGAGGAGGAGASGEAERRLEAELKSMKEQNKALTLYINKIIERLLQHHDFESILDQSGDMNPPTTGAGAADTSKDLPPPPPPSSDKPQAATSFIQRAKSMAGGSNRMSAGPPPRPMSYIHSTASSAHTDPDTAPSIPIGNLTRSASKRHSRPRSEQYTGSSSGAVSLVSQMYKGPDGPTSPTLGNPRHSQSFFAPGVLPINGGNANSAAAARVPSSSGSVNGSQHQPSSSGNFPGMRSETSSVSGDSAGDLSTPPSQSPPRSHSDKGTTFTGGKPRPLRLVQENPEVGGVKENKRASWISGWSNWGKKEEGSSGDPIPE